MNTSPVIQRMESEAHSELNYIALRTALEQYQKSLAELSDKELLHVMRQAERQYDINVRILSSDEALNTIIPEAVVDKSLADVIARYPDETTFLNDLENNGMDEDILRHALERELRVDAILEKVASRAADINELDVSLYYYLHMERFHQPETRTVRHILVTINDDYPENTRENAKQLIDKIRARVQKKTRLFSEQALKHSECPTSMNGGLLGRVPRGQLYPQLDDVLFRLKTGEVSDVVESEVGFHVLLCEKIHKEGPASLREARPKIQEHLRKRRQEICKRSWLAGLLNEENEKSG
jgi:nitrogen fixation protein NifM